MTTINPQATNIAKAKTSPLTGRDIADAISSDFNMFFWPGSGFTVRVETAPCNMPFVCKDKTGSYIKIPREMADDEVTTPARLLFHLLMIGHEIGHLTHRHLEGANAQSDEEYRSLELWADFYGAKVAMAVLTYGSRLHAIARTMWPSRDLHLLLNDFGEAVSLLVSKVYREHKRYPIPLDRAGLVSNGVMSFVRNYYGPDFDFRLYYSVYNRVLLSPKVRGMIAANAPHEYDNAFIKTSLEWHRKAQGAASAITPGMLPHVSRFLDTAFDLTDEEMAESQRVRTEELQKSGLIGLLGG